MQKSLVKNMIFKFALNISNIIFPLLVNSYVLRKFGDVTMGYINFNQTLYNIFVIFSTFGVYQYGLREISRVRDDKQKMASVFTNLFIITLVTNIITLIVYLLFIQNTYSTNNQVVYSVGLIMGLNLLANVFYVEWVAEALEEFDFITIKSIVIQILYFIGIFTIVKNADDYKEYALLVAISLILNYLVSFIYVKKKIKFNFSELNLGKHFIPMFMVVILSNANILYTQLDRSLLGAVGEFKTVGYYVTAQGIMYIVNILMLTVVHVTIPRLSNLLSLGDNEGYSKLLNKITKVYLLFLYPAAIGLLVVGRECVLIYGGNQFENAIPYMKFFAIYMITVGFENIFSNQIMYLNGKEKVQVRFVFLGGVFNILFKAILLVLGIFNGTTAIITTIIANTVLVGIQYFYIVKNLKIDIKIFSISKIKYLVISLFFIPISIILRQFLTGVIIPFIVIIAVNIVFYFVVLYLIKDEVVIDGIEFIKLKIRKIKL